MSRVSRRQGTKSTRRNARTVSREKRRIRKGLRPRQWSYMGGKRRTGGGETAGDAGVATCRADLVPTSSKAGRQPPNVAITRHGG